MSSAQWRQLDRNIYGVRCVPSCHPSASRNYLSYVPLKVQEGVTFLPVPIHVSRRHHTQKLFLLSCSGFWILSLCPTAPQLCHVGSGSVEPSLSGRSIAIFPNSGEKANQNVKVWSCISINLLSKSQTFQHEHGYLTELWIWRSLSLGFNLEKPLCMTEYVKGTCTMFTIHNFCLTIQSLRVEGSVHLCLMWFGLD